MRLSLALVHHQFLPLLGSVILVISLNALEVAEFSILLLVLLPCFLLVNLLLQDFSQYLPLLQLLHLVFVILVRLENQDDFLHLAQQFVFLEFDLGDLL